jgi:alkylated DNA repair dioxygenase AlkB
MERINLPNSDIRVYKKFIPDANDYWESLLNLEWEYKTIKLGYKTCVQNRKTYLCGDNGVEFKYSGTNTTGDGVYPAVIKEIMTKVENELQVKFNFCLANHYADGTQNIGMHSDSIQVGPIVTLSFGANRFFDFKSIDGQHKERLELEAGTMVVMDVEKTQKYYKHGIPVQKKIKEPRISLTFRVI